MMAEILEIHADYDLLDLHHAHPARYPYLLESVVHDTTRARYDILFAFPGQTLELSTFATIKGDGLNIQGTDFLQNLDAWWLEQASQQKSALKLPFSGGWFVYLGYELAAQIETCLRLPEPQHNLPIAFASRIPAAAIRDHHTCRTFLVAETGSSGLLETLTADIMALQCSEINKSMPLNVALEEDSPAEFIERVHRILHYIKEGDVFQVNLSRHWQGHIRERVSAAQIYRRLRRRNPAPFAGLAMYGASAIISSSPERLLSTRAGIIETRPIAGTRPRTEGQPDDELQALLAHPKERAEHIMLIDLERNDLGRVCVPGSVEVDELMVAESYAHVHHIVSNVRGRLRASVAPGEAIRAVFPGGTITGCPKVRCMEIIAELEQAPRGAYTGAMGYINLDGSMDFNILIRTLVKDGQHISLRAGAGIVADSIPQKELEETRAKAQGLLLALV